MLGDSTSVCNFLRIQETRSAFSGQAEKVSVPVEFPEDGVWDVHTLAQRRCSVWGGQLGTLGFRCLGSIDAPCHAFRHCHSGHRCHPQAVL